MRDPDDRVVAGVCAALGRYTGTDPVLWRVAVAVLTLFGGTGLVLYAVGWALTPTVDAPQSWAERTLRRPGGGITPAGVAVAVALGVVLLAGIDNGPGVFALLVVAGVAYLVLRQRRGGQLPAGPTGQWAPPEPRPDGRQTYVPGPSFAGAPFPGGTQAWGAAAPARARRPRSLLTPVTLSVAALLAGVLLVLDQLGVAGITAPRVLAGSLLVVGLGLVVGTWRGRGRWLIPVGLALALLLVPVSLFDGQLSGGTGERTWVPGASDAAGAYQLGVGDATLDLRRLEPGSRYTLRAQVGAGRLLVLLPTDLPVRVQPELRAGTLRIVQDGVSSEQDVGPLPSDRLAPVDLGPSEGRRLDLQLIVGVGELEVRS